MVECAVTDYIHVPCHTCDFVARLWRATKSQRATMKSHAATLSRDRVARQSRAIKSQVWHGTYDTSRYVVDLRPNLRPIVRAISFVNNHRGRKLVRPFVRPTTVYDLSWISPQVWNVLHAARWKIQDTKIAKKSPSRNHRTILSGCIFTTKACIDNGEKLVKQQYLLHMSSQYMANFGPLTAEIGSGVWAPLQISTGFASWLRYCTDVAHWRSSKLCTMFGHLPGLHTMYTLCILYCKIHFVSKSCVLLYMGSVTARHLSSGRQPICGVVQLGMELRNFRRKCHLYSAGRPLRWASAQILEQYFYFRFDWYHTSKFLMSDYRTILNYFLTRKKSRMLQLSTKATSCVWKYGRHPICGG